MTTEAKSAAASIEAALNLYNGGADKASVRQANLTFLADRASLEATIRDTQSQTKNNYLSVLSDISRIHALKQAVASGEASLKTTTEAYMVGNNTILLQIS